MSGRRKQKVKSQERHTHQKGSQQKLKQFGATGSCKEKLSSYQYKKMHQ